MKNVKNLALVLLAGLTLVVASYAWSFRHTLFAPERSFAETREYLLPHLQVLLPEASEPRPAVLYFHGCGGPASYDSPRAQQVVDEGYVAIIVDSFTGRGINWEDSCSGRILPGTQRAADVLVALDFARQHPAVDPERLFLAGFSHGGWTVLDALAGGDALPDKLADSPGGHLQGVRGVIAWYPYCGLGTGFTSGWQSEVPVLVLLAAEDQTTAPEPCIDVVVEQAAAGNPASYQLYPGVDHGFDLQAEWVRIYDPEIHRQSMQAQSDFLERNSG